MRTETEPWSYHPDGSPVYSLADIIRKRAAISPAPIALAEPGRLTSFADLDRRSSQVAQALQRKGVAPGDRVAFIGASGPEFAEVLYGTAKCGAIFTAVNNRLAAPEILAILADAEPSVLVVDPAAAPLAADAACDTIVSGGENVYPAEVESVMTGHPTVAEVAVVSVPSADWGESPYAVVVLRPGAQVSADELIGWTRDRLAHYKCPVGVSFAPALARTASGKLQKQAIRSSLGSLPVP